MNGNILRMGPRNPRSIFEEKLLQKVDELEIEMKRQVDRFRETVIALNITPLKI
jgi:hypothetical protein